MLNKLELPLLLNKLPLNTSLSLKSFNDALASLNERILKSKYLMFDCAIRLFILLKANSLMALVAVAATWLVKLLPVPELKLRLTITLNACWLRLLGSAR
ncbi:hypothetical protein HK413_08045 [Mucilaginibacter sp. S1162]|uniref:Uncharacterized protein n=1 Tax=Mucilaginibacter humi TaxID=2732510 RepID=A0ABX1W1K3_9SPHI|nr:hypothetical protein [Mucilaginibacter humi]NNU34107.1 hypothetical protein [Mucilaginibacter humi]